MRAHPIKGWAVFSRSSRTEWPLTFTIRGTRREAAQAMRDELATYLPADQADALYAERIADGSMRLGRVIVQAAP
jgi:hypothetical protein